MFNASLTVFARESEFNATSQDYSLTTGFKHSVKTVLGQKTLIGLNFGWVMTQQTQPVPPVLVYISVYAFVTVSCDFNYPLGDLMKLCY